MGIFDKAKDVLASERAEQDADESAAGDEGDATSDDSGRLAQEQLGDYLNPSGLPTGAAQPMVAPEPPSS